MGNKIEYLASYAGNFIGYAFEIHGLINFAEYVMNGRKSESLVNAVSFYVVGRFVNNSMGRIREFLRKEKDKFEFSQSGSLEEKLIG